MRNKTPNANGDSNPNFTRTSDKNGLYVVFFLADQKLKLLRQDKLVNFEKGMLSLG